MWAWEPLTKCGSTLERVLFLLNRYHGTTAALNGEHRVISQHRGSWWVSTGGSHLLRMVGGLNELNGVMWHVVASRGHGMNNRLHGGNPLQMADHLDDMNWCGIGSGLKRVGGCSG